MVGEHVELGFGVVEHLLISGAVTSKPVTVTGELAAGHHRAFHAGPPFSLGAVTDDDRIDWLRGWVSTCACGSVSRTVHRGGWRWRSPPPRTRPRCRGTHARRLAPTSARTLPNKLQLGRMFLAGVGETNDQIAQVIVFVQHLAQHVGAGATAGKPDDRRPGQFVG